MYPKNEEPAKKVNSSPYGCPRCQDLEYRCEVQKTKAHAICKCVECGHVWEVLLYVDGIYVPLGE